MANLWELRLVKGVGETIAMKVIQEREKKRFINKDDLYRRTNFPKLFMSLVEFQFDINRYTPLIK